MIRTISLALLIVGLCIELWLKYKSAAARRKKRAKRKRYLKKFREGQRECDELFREHESEEQTPEQEYSKWVKQSIVCKNPDLITFWR